jgi:hypothetical protein
MSKEEMKAIIKQYDKPIEIRPYGEVKEKLDKLVKETAVSGAEAFIKMVNGDVKHE